ncbi:MAG: hydroxymethylbilane synthase, partial [Candidatus Rokubacteria bacterium]|nr:hydroxymethylbilane synthase [Candidatus Rokubacteria bacterium]
MTPIRIGTRGSPLALRQAELVRERLEALMATGHAEIVPIRTSGDLTQPFGPGSRQVALADFGGKGLFVKEIEEALLEGRVDLAVHSLKDLPAALPPGLCLAAFPPREDPRDVMLSRLGGGIASVPPAAEVGTTCLRRRVLLLAQ